MECPEHLLDHRGALAAQDKRALEEHARTCAACAVEHTVASFVETASADGTLERLTARACDGAMDCVARARSARRRRRTVLAGTVAAALVVGFAAAASLRGAAGPRASRPLVDATGARDVPSAIGETFAPTETIPTVSVEDLARAPTAATAKTASGRVSAPEDHEDAAALFARANRTRQAGSSDAALRLYRDLGRRYPSSTEAAVARISAARLLAASGDVRGALAEYDAYLSDDRRVELREEAVVGRARGACAALELEAEEVHAWEMLLRDFPRSIHAAHAQERLAALGPR